MNCIRDELKKPSSSRRSTMDFLKKDVTIKRHGHSSRRASLSLFKDDATASPSSSSTLFTGAMPTQGSSRSLMMTVAKSVSARSLMSSVSSIDSVDEELCLNELESFCTIDNNYDISHDEIFRFAHFHNFDHFNAKSAIEERVINKYLDIRMDSDLAEQFESKLIFPLPELALKHEKSRVLYMRPSRYQDSSRNEEKMVESLCYVLNDCSRTEADCRDGVAMVIDMNGWTEENFNQDLWARVMRVLQGDLVPTKVKTVLIVNAPKEFLVIWNSIRKSLQTSFSKNVIMIKESKLAAFFREGYEEHMPSDFIGTWRSSSEIVEDYVDFKTYHDKR